MKTGIVLRLPAGDWVELEIAFIDFIENLNLNSAMLDDTQVWGECRILQGTTLHGIQYSITEDGDCVIDCRWHENENYVE